MTVGDIKSHIEMHLMRLLGGKDNKSVAGIQQFMGGEIYKSINEAYRVFLDRTRLLESSASVTITSGYGTLPADCYHVLRVEDSAGEQITGRVQRRFNDTDLPK